MVLGDSLSDTGNSFTVRGGTFPPSPPYASGRFTDDLSFLGLPIPPGQVWVEHLAGFLQLSPPRARLTAGQLPPVNGETNYAFAGAVTGDVPAAFEPALTPGQQLVGGLPLDRQVDFFLADVAALASSGNCAADVASALFAVWIGSNDFLLLGSDDPGGVVDNVADNIERLIDAGADDFLVANLPDLAAVPAAGGTYTSLFVAGGLAGLTPKELGKRVVQFNAKLERALDKIERRHPGVRIARLDVFALVGDVLEQPAAYGFDANTAVPLLDEQALFVDMSPAPGAFLRFNEHPLPAAALFWDGVHPGSRAHAVVGAAACRALARADATCE